jgi:O-antigen/teichoic acid export membrane protein
MKRTFVTNLVLVLFLNLLVKPFWIFGIDRTVQNVVGAETYGFYFSLFSFSLLLNILLDIGITNFNNRSIAREPSLLKQYLSDIVILKLLLVVLYAFVCLSAGLFIGYESKQFSMLIILIVNQFLASLILYLRSNISGLHLFRTDSLISVLDRALASVFCGVLIWGNVTSTSFRIEWFVWSQTAAYLITAVVTFIIVVRKAGHIRLQFSTGRMMKLLRSSYPFALLVLLMSFYYRMDTVMIERILNEGKEQAGIYAQSFRILDAAGMFAFLFAGLLLPIFSRMLKQQEHVGEMVQLSFTLIFIPAIILAVMAAFFNTEIIDWLYNEYIGPSARIFPLLMFGFVAVSMTYIFGTLLTANGNLRFLNLLALSAVVINFLLNLILIPRYKAFGAAVSSLITQFYMAIVQVLISVVKFKLRLNYPFLLLLAFYSTLILLTGWLCSLYVPNWHYGALIYLSVSITFPFVIRLLRFRDLIILFLPQT